MHDNGNTPAHPHPIHHGLKGLTKREYFAGLAMQGLALHTGADPSGIAAYAVSLADAILAELDKTEKL